MKRKITAVILLVIVIFITYWSIDNDKENNEIVKKAIAVGEKYFKKHYDIQVVFTEHEIMGGYTGSTIDLSGHVKDEPNEEVSILINYQDYTVVTALVSDELYRKRVPGKD